MNKITESKIKDCLTDLKNYLVETAEGRFQNGAMNGDFKKDGSPNKDLISSELEFFTGAYSCLTFIMHKLEDITHDEAMKYFPPTLWISALRGESIVKNFKEDRKTS